MFGIKNVFGINVPVCPKTKKESLARDPFFASNNKQN
jgi:hypothetical protein